MRIAWASTVGIISNIVLIASVVVLIVEIRQNQVSMLAQSSYERTQMAIANDQALVKDAQKINRKTAAEFSFFLAVPTMLRATVKKSYDYYNSDLVLSGDQVNYLIIGNIIAFIVAFLAIKSFISFLSKKGFKLFGYYRIILGITLLVIHFFIHPLSVI